MDNNNYLDRNNLYESIDIKKAWTQVERVVIRRSKKRVLSIMLKYAAAILLPVLLGITANWYLNDRIQNKDQPLAEIQPGSSNAVLIMANGENIDLTNRTAKNLVEHDGTVINNTNKELRYAGQSDKNAKEVILNTLIVPKGGEYSLVLSDGTKVFINSMSRLVFPVRFSGDNREITLEEGEAYFEVAKDKSKPFIITVKGIKVEVLGTSFNIKAYSEDDNLYTTLVEGKVKINLKSQPSNIHYLEPDQQAVFNPTASQIVIQKVDAKQIVQWTTGKYSFTNQTLDEIMKTLSRWYDFDYQYEDETLKQIRFEGGLNKYESIEPILEIIKKTGKVNVSVKGKEVLFSKI